MQKESHAGCVCFGGVAKFSLMTQPPLLAVVQRWCKEGNNALSQLIHTFGVVRSREIVLEFERTTPSTPFILNSSTSGALKLGHGMRVLQRFDLSQFYRRFRISDFRTHPSNRSLNPKSAIRNFFLTVFPCGEHRPCSSCRPIE